MGQICNVVGGSELFTSHLTVLSELHLRFIVLIEAHLQILSKQGKMVMQFGIAGTDDGHLFYPKKVVALRPRASLPDGGYIVVDKGDNKARLQLFSKVGEFIHKIGAVFSILIGGLFSCYSLLLYV